MMVVSLGLVVVLQCAMFLRESWPQLASLVLSNVDLYRIIMSESIAVTTSVAMVSLLVTMVMVWVLFLGPPTMYLVDYACFKPGKECKMTSEHFLKLAVESKLFTEKSLEFQRKILANSGLGSETYAPLSMHSEPVDMSLPTCMKEVKTALFSPMIELLKRTWVKPTEIGVLVVNCSTFCPIPSISAMVVNHFGLREDTETYNLGGIGCSAGVIAISLAQHLLKVHRNTYGVVLSGMQAYKGNDPSMLVGNCIFRWGASAILLSNKRSDSRRAKYSLLHVIRTHRGANERSFECVKSLQDPEGYFGVSLSKELMVAAGDALTSNITTLAPKILPFSEKLKFVVNFIVQKFLQVHCEPYMPNFQTAIDHFCIHPGGKAVLDKIEKNLQLSNYDMEPARMTLHRFGNTSSSSIWYVLAYMEAKNRVRKNDIIWQIALGSGIKCNSAIWKSLQNNQVNPYENPWLDDIDIYPVTLHHSSTSNPKS